MGYLHDYEWLQENIAPHFTTACQHKGAAILFVIVLFRGYSQSTWPESEATSGDGVVQSDEDFIWIFRCDHSSHKI